MARPKKTEEEKVKSVKITFQAPIESVEPLRLAHIEENKRTGYELSPAQFFLRLLKAGAKALNLLPSEQTSKK